MDKSYLSQLSRAARWRLPPAEARDVLSDYGEMLEQNPRSDEELRRDMGNPVEAVRLLVQPEQYRRWLIVFCILSACLLLPAVSPFVYRLLNLFTQSLDLPVELIFLVTGLAISLVWFHWEGGREKGRPFPKMILLFLALELIGIGCVWFVIWMTLGERYDIMFALSQTGRGIGWIADGLSWLVLALAVGGIFGLIKARMDDRRWRAVYVLGLTAAVLWLSVLSMLRDMSLDPFPTDWWLDDLRQYLLLTAIGLVGTGVSLC